MKVSFKRGLSFFVRKLGIRIVKNIYNRGGYMSLFVNYICQDQQLSGIIPELLSRQSWGVDTETTGLDPFVDTVILLQIGNEDIQYVIDVRKVNIEPLRGFLESLAITKIMHNGKFDYKMIKQNHGIAVEGIKDTFLGEKCLCSGKKRSGFGLGAVLMSRLGVEVDKEAQKSFINHKGEFSQKQLEYAAADVMYLGQLAAAQEEVMAKEGLLDIWKIENYSLPAFGDMELNGMRLDVKKWKDNIRDNKEKAEEVAKEMGQFSIPYVGQDLFGNANINYDSPAQMLSLMKRMDVMVPERVDGQTVEIPIPDTSDKTLKKIKDGYPIVDMLKRYRSLQVRVNTFGQSFIDAIHPATGKIHPMVNQYGTETGRPAKASDSPINSLNIPRDKVFRNSFIADPDHLIETDDYSGCELRIWAEVSGDPALTEAFQQGIDVHCMVASRMYGVEVTKSNENKFLRTPAKALNFGIIYGMGPSTLCEDIRGMGFDITMKETRDLYRKYTRELFPVGVDYLREVGRRASRDGYVANMNGRRRYFILPNPGDENTYPGGMRDKKYTGRIASIEREGGNHVIQSVNADMTKYAMFLIRRYINKYGVRSKILGQVYDEIITMTHKDDSPAFHEKKKELMLYAAKAFLKTVPMEVEGEALPYWTK